MITPGTDAYLFFNSIKSQLTPKSKKTPAMIIRNGLRGGMVETFNLMVRETNELEIRYWDICSLYPFIAMSNVFPTGPGYHLKGPKMSERLKVDHQKKCFVFREDNGCFKACDGIVLAEVGIDPKLHH